MIGQTIENRYQLNQEIGRGGFALVYLALDLRLEQLCAVKVATDQVGGQLLQNEAKRLVALRHPQLPQILDLIVVGESTYMVMTYIEGIHLEDYLIKHGPMPEQKALEMMLSLTQVFSYLHNLHPYPVIHRDLKPKNIIVQPSGKLCVLDFGASREFSMEKTTDTTYISTLGYASPELLSGHQTDERSDIYALGVTFSQMLSGNTQSQVLNPLVQKNKVDTLSRSHQIIMQCTQYHPFERYQNIQGLQEAILSLSESANTGATGNAGNGHTNAHNNGHTKNHQKKYPRSLLALVLMVMLALAFTGGVYLPALFNQFIWASPNAGIATELAPSVVALVDKQVAIKAFSEQYMSLKEDKNLPLYANVNQVTPQETFLVEKVDQYAVALKAANGLYLSVPYSGKGPILAKAKTIGPREKFEIQNLGIKNNHRFFAIKNYKNYYVTANLSANGEMVCRSKEIGGGWETFIIAIQE